MTKPETAIEYFEQGFNCSQSVLVAFQGNTGMAEDDLLRIS
jgi:hypothetical protein